MQWEIKKELNAARSHPAVTVVNGKIYAIGGGAANFKSLSSIECYDPANNSWIYLSDMPTKRSGSVAVGFDGKIYVIGGGYKKTDGNFCFLPTVEIYDISKDKWDTGPDMNQTHDYPAVSIIGDEIYILAGHHPDATVGGPKTDPGSTFCEKWKIGSSSWKEIPSISVPRFGGTAQTINNEIWMMGGIGFTKDGFNNYDIIEIFNPEQNCWRIEENISLPWPAAAHTSVKHKDKLYVMGGYCGNSIHAVISSTITGKTNEWENLLPMPEARAAIGCVVCNNHLYVIAGWAEDGRTPVNTLFSLSL